MKQVRAMLAQPKLAYHAYCCAEDGNSQIERNYTRKKNTFDLIGQLPSFSDMDLA